MLEIVDKQHSEPHYHSDHTRANSTASSFPRTSAHSIPSNNYHNNYHNTTSNTTSTSYLSNNNHQPQTYSQDSDSALDLDTLLGKNSHYHCSKETSYAQKENNLKPNTFNNSNTSGTGQFDANANNSSVQSHTTHNDQNDIDWNLFDAPAPVTMTKFTIPTNPTSTTTINIHLMNNASTKASTISNNDHTSSLSLQPSNGHSDKVVSDGVIPKVHPSHSVIVNSSSNRVSSGDAELRLEDLF